MTSEEELQAVRDDLHELTAAEKRYDDAYEMAHMRASALGRVQAACYLKQEAAYLLTDAMRAYRKAGGTDAILVSSTGMKLGTVRAIVTGKRTAA